MSLSSVTESLQPLRNSRSSLYSNCDRRKREWVTDTEGRWAFDSTVSLLVGTTMFSGEGLPGPSLSPHVGLHLSTQGLGQGPGSSQPQSGL